MTDTNDLAFNNWDVTYRESGVKDAESLSIYHTSGRVEICIEPLEEYDEVTFPVNVYESTHYDYKHREFIGHSLVGTVRPGTAGNKTAKSFRAAITLAINAVLSIERDARWLSEPVETPPRMFVNEPLTKNEAAELVREKFNRDEILKKNDDGKQFLIDRAEETGEWGLAEFIYSLSMDDYWWFMDGVYEVPENL